MKKIVTSIMLMSMLSASAVQQKNILEAIFRKLGPIEDLSLSIVAKVSNIQNNTVTILQEINDLTLSQSDFCCSGLDTLVSREDLILSKLDALTLTFPCCSKIDTILSQQDHITSLLQALNVVASCCSKTDIILSQEEQIIAEIDNLSFSALDLPCSSKIDILNSSIDLIESQIIINSQISLADSACCSKIDLIESQLDLIESQIDLLNFSSLIDPACCSQIEFIESQLDVIESKIELVDLSALVDGSCCSDLAVIESQLDLIESKVDLLGSPLSIGAECCSKVDQIVDQVNQITNQLSLFNNNGLAEPCCSKVDIIENQVNFIQTQLNTINNISTACAATPITGASFLANTGFSYCVSNDILGTLTIAASSVTIDLNNHTVNSITNSFPVDQIVIRNGILDGATPLSLTGVTNIVLENLTIRSGIGSGVQLTNVKKGSIKNVTFLNNITGLQLTDCADIVVSNCIAQDNSQEGFDLVSSTTCLFIDCKALNTGKNNVSIFNNDIFGFVSQDGSGNIFERCIADATQAPFTTDSNSLIAGFAFLGNEQSSKIVDSESANCTTSASGVTIPYGILLQGTLGSTITLTAVPPVPVPTNTVSSVDWSGDGIYVAAGTLEPQLHIYQFNRNDSTLMQVAVAANSASFGAIIRSVNWSPDGQHLAIGLDVGDADRLRIYYFDRTNNRLTQVAQPTGADIPGDNVTSVNWSFDGNYVAIGLSPVDPFKIRIYKYNRINNSLIQVAVPTGSDVPADRVSSVDWSPDGQYLATGISSGDPYLIRIYYFNRATNTLTQVAGPDIVPSSSVNSVNWSFDGQYLAAGTSEPNVRIYYFDRAAATLAQVAVAGTTPSDAVTSVDWSANSYYLAIGTSLSSIQVYYFDRGGALLTQVAVPDVAPGGIVFSVNWSPDGQYLAAGMDSADTNRINLYQALSFPSGNIISGNTVYCNSGALFPSGVGISAPSICNEIIGNNAYSNPINKGTNAPIVPSNYLFVCNVFNQLFEQTPSSLQNIGLGGCEPIAQQEDVILLLQQNQYLYHSAIDLLMALI